MDTSATYDKIYFQDDYRQQLEELRSRYRTRTQNALGESSVDHHPVSNVKEIIYFHDDDQGGVRITSTGDFIDYFNHKYGNNNRIGAMRRAIAVAEHKAEKSEHLIKENRMEQARKEEHVGFADRIRTAGRRLTFVHAVFAMMLVLSVVMLSVSYLLVGDVNRDVAALEMSVAGAESTEVDQGVILLENAADLELANENSVEIYSTEESGLGIAALLNALFSLDGK